MQLSRGYLCWGASVTRTGERALLSFGPLTGRSGRPPAPGSSNKQLTLTP